MSTRGRKADLVVIEGGLEEIPDVPAHIPAGMHQEWLDVVDDLRKRKLLTDAMLGSVEAYVMALHNMRLAQKAIDDFGAVIASPKGVPVKNPAVTLHGKAQSTVSRLAAELGLTPAARSRPKMRGDGGGEAGGGERQQMEDLFGQLVDI
ncbi:phage terminase small subunit P27 family [Ensifer sp. PDNC004]|uniref:phage terminase small subunit P27 family n=1 Tax=Ensifer sp. PDNC004 TaxID=2811423 RepID=UPI001965D904|nr:phage terminase small subunit P27 family [Ensifer sp. PDNC004]QRY66553.1 phage terminase small subunit P27 family [Ensifer sp. PDNC004]